MVIDKLILSEQMKIVSDQLNDWVINYVKEHVEEKIDYYLKKA